MPEDKRICKTRELLRCSLRKILEEKSFEDVTVMEICKKADISRITFYARYKDKDELLRNLFNEFGNKSLQICIEYNRINNHSGNPKLFCINLFAAVSQVVFNGWISMLKAIADENGYAYRVFLSYLRKNMDELLKKLETGFILTYSKEQTLSILFDGALAFLKATVSTDNITAEEVKNQCVKFYTALIDICVQDSKN